MREKLDRSAWLHSQIGGVASRVVGLDSDQAGVEIARRLGYEAHLADCQRAESIADAGITPSELVIAGEIIEHLDRPGDFLDAVRQLVAPGGELVITTPNPTALTNVVLGLAGREVQNADHVGWHSWRTLDTLLGRHRYTVSELAYYRHPRFVAATGASARERARCRLFNLYESITWPILAAAPSLADGVIVAAKPEGA
jgi:SAM-dependent methyltransferase